MDATLVKRAASDAIAVQNGCNSSGILFAFNEHVRALETHREENGLPQEWLTRHPVVFLFVDKLDDLCGTRGMEPNPPRKEDTLSASVQEFAGVMRQVCDETRQMGTDAKNSHTRVQTGVRNLVGFCGTRDWSLYGKAYKACERMAETGEFVGLNE